jgi:hypothetical protein
LFSVLVGFMIICCSGSILVMFVWGAGSFLYLDVHIFLEIWKFFSYYFIEYITYTFGLHWFSFYSVHDLQVWSFDRVAEFLHISFTAL